MRREMGFYSFVLIMARQIISFPFRSLHLLYDAWGHSIFQFPFTVLSSIFLSTLESASFNSSDVKFLTRCKFCGIHSVCSISTIENQLFLANSQISAKSFMQNYFVQYTNMENSFDEILKVMIFTLAIISQKMCYLEHLFFRWIELRIVIWHIFGESGAKLKISEINPPL